MKRIHLLWIFYLSAAICLTVQSYCNQQALQYFDFKSLTGNNQALAEVWLTRINWAFLIGLISIIAGSACTTFHNRWEHCALAVCALRLCSDFNCIVISHNRTYAHHHMQTWSIQSLANSVARLDEGWQCYQ